MLIATLMFSGIAVGANIGIRATMVLTRISEERIEEFRYSECGKMIQEVFKEGHRQFHLNKAKKASRGVDLADKEAQEDNEGALEELWIDKDPYASHSNPTLTIEEIEAIKIKEIKCS